MTPMCLLFLIDMISCITRCCFVDEFRYQTLDPPFEQQDKERGGGGALLHTLEAMTIFFPQLNTLE